MDTRPRWGLPEWHRWLHDQNGAYQSDQDDRYWDYQCGPDRYIAKMGTTGVANIATWPRWELPEWPGWPPGHDGDYQSDIDGNMAKMGTTGVA